MGARLRWRSRMDGNRFYQQRLRPGLHATMAYVSQEMATFAKHEARWTDRTGLARSGLIGYAHRISATKIAAVISHGPLVTYGKYLEANPKFAIIPDAVDHGYSILWPRLKREIFR